MDVIAHAGHWTLGLLQAAPVLVVAAFAVWRALAARSGRGADGAAAGIR